jgi:PAS domain S-box-containing protein
MPKLLTIRSFKMKLLFMIWIGSITTLFLACGFFIYFDVAEFDKDLIKEMKIISNFIADKSAPAVMFNDPVIAEDALFSAAAAEPAIINAVVYDAETNVVAAYERNRAHLKEFVIPEPQQNKTFFKDGHLHLFSDIALYSDVIGTVYIQADRHALYKRIQRYVVIVVGIMAISLLVIALISFFLQKLVSIPVMALIASAKLVSEKKDYATRVNVKSDDELGDLAAAFNEMLAKIQESDSALRESEKQFRTVVDQAADAFFLVDPDTAKFVDVNPRACEILKYSREEILTFSVNDIGPSEQKGKFRQATRNLRLGDTITIDAIHKRRDGTTYPVEIRSSLIEIHGNKFVSAFARDVTERKQAKEALRQSEERFSLFMSHMPGIAFIKDGQGKYVYANEQMCSLVNKSVEDIIGLTNEDLFPPETAAQLSRNDAHVHSQKAPITAEESLVLKGRRVHYVTIKFPFPMPEGSLSGVAGVGVDISEIQQAREEKTALETQLRQTQKMESIGTLAGGIAHDFNNILSAIIGYTDLSMQDIPENDKLRYHLEQIMQAGFRARDLVKQILMFSRQSEQDPQPVKLSLIVKEAAKLLRASLPTTIDFKVHITAKNDIALADATQIHQILMNLCTNAGHAMREKGGVLSINLAALEFNNQTVVVDTELLPGPYLKLTITDSGHGIPPEILKKIFDPFFTTKSRGEGTGMGLSVVHGIVKNHGGAIDVSSEPGQGTAVCVFFPRLEAALEKKEDPATPFPTGNERILVVDDEVIIVDMLQKSLSRQGYTVVTKTSSWDALATFKADPESFDLIITDQTMPKMTGIELAKEALRVRPEIPIILCTGFSHILDEEKAKDMGLVEFLLKPVITKDMMRAVRRALDRDKS